MNMKMMKQYGLVAVLVLFAGLGGGLALGQRGGDETGNTGVGTTKEESSDEGKPPPSLKEKTYYSDEKDVTTQHVVRAKRFELEDDKGNIRAVLGLSADGEPRIALAAPNGQIIVGLSLEIDHKYTQDKLPTLRLYDMAGKIRSEISVNRVGEPVIILRNQRGGTMASLSGSDKTGTEWMLMDESGRPRIVQNINRNGTTLSFFDEAGKTRAGFGLKPDGNPSLVFYDEKMKDRVVLGYVDGKSAQKGSKDKKTVSSLALFDKDGKVLWKAP